MLMNSFKIVIVEVHMSLKLSYHSTACLQLMYKLLRAT